LPVPTSLSATEVAIPSPRRSSTRKISWDVLRVFAVYSVVVEHVTHQSPINHPELGGYPFALPWRFGAATMLVISAYFVCVTIGKKRPGKWLWNRFARLLPAYFIAVLVTYVVTRLAVTAFNGLTYAHGDWLFGIPVGGDLADRSWLLPGGHDLVGNLFMIQAWDPSLLWVDPSYWTLPIQLVAFTCAAVLVGRRLITGRGVPVLFWSLAVVPVLLRIFVRDPSPYQWVKSIFDGLAVNQVALFGVGIAIYWWSTRRMSLWHLALYLVAAMTCLDWQSYFTDTENIVAISLVLIPVVFAAGGRDWDIPLVRRMTPAITWLAGISYGVYLTHQVLGYIFNRVLLDLGARPWERMVASFAIAIVLGWLMTRLVERPVHRFLSHAGPALVEWVKGAKRQIQAGRLGTSPARPEPSLRPVSQASTVVAGPPTSGESLPSMLPASSQSR
jgi:peptidoglycan/LPS O-acetylase OafA/YrhL